MNNYEFINESSREFFRPVRDYRSITWKTFSSRPFFRVIRVETLETCWGRVDDPGAPLLYKSLKSHISHRVLLKYFHLISFSRHFGRKEKFLKSPAVDNRRILFMKRAPYGVKRDCLEHFFARKFCEGIYLAFCSDLVLSALEIIKTSRVIRSPLRTKGNFLGEKNIQINFLINNNFILLILRWRFRKASSDAERWRFAEWAGGYKLSFFWGEKSENMKSWSGRK